jgi:hypothetical protein
MEESRGSLWLLFTILQVSLLTNLLVLVLGLALGLGAGSEFFLTVACAGGFWPACFGLMVLDAMEAPEEERPLLCFPVRVAAKWIPLILAGIFLLLSLARPNLGILLGLLVGYLLHYCPSMQLSLARASRWEASPKLAWFTGASGFRSGAVQVGNGGGGWAAAGFRQNEPQSRFATLYGASSSQPPQQQQPSVFSSGQGHRLGSAADSGALAPAVAAASLAPVGQTMPPSSAAAGPLAPAPAQSAAAQAEARRQRAAAIDKRLGKATSGTGSALSGATPSPRRSNDPAASSAPRFPSPSAPSMPTSASPSLERPPSPSALRSSLGDSLRTGPSSNDATSAQAAASSALFTLGLDEDEADLESQRLNAANSSAAAAASVRADEAQGFVAGSGAKQQKKGYSSVSSSAIDDEADLEAAMLEDDNDNASEHTRVQTQR